MAENEITYTERDVKFRFSNRGCKAVHDVVSDQCWECGKVVSAESTDSVSRINGNSRFGYEPHCTTCSEGFVDPVEEVYELEAQYAEQSPEREPRIVEVHIIWPSRQMMRYQATAMALFDDDTLDDVLVWYSDELFFDHDDFLGKTRYEVGQMFTKKDIAYLQS